MSKEKLKYSEFDFRLPPIHFLQGGLTVQSETADYYVRDYMQQLHAAGAKGAGVSVVIADTGLSEHQDLDGQIIGGKNYTGRGGESDFVDRNFHGTFCGGIYAAKENGTGIIGAAPESKLYGAKVLTDGGGGSFVWLLELLNDLIDLDLGGENIIVNMSLGSPAPFPPIDAAVQRLYAERPDVMLVGAAGNSGNRFTDIHYPARYDEFIAVGAVDQQKNIASFSSRGASGDISAAGVQMLSTYIGGGYARASGTSFSTPHLGAVVACIWGAFPKLTRDQIRTAIEETAIDRGTPGFDPNYFRGVVNPVQAYERAKKINDDLFDDDDGDNGDGDNQLKGQLSLTENGLSISLNQSIDWTVN